MPISHSTMGSQDAALKQVGTSIMKMCKIRVWVPNSSRAPVRQTKAQSWSQRAYALCTCTQTAGCVCTTPCIHCLLWGVSPSITLQYLGYKFKGHQKSSTSQHVSCSHEPNFRVSQDTLNTKLCLYGWAPGKAPSHGV